VIDKSHTLSTIAYLRSTRMNGTLSGFGGSVKGESPASASISIFGSFSRVSSSVAIAGTGSDNGSPLPSDMIWMRRESSPLFTRVNVGDEVFEPRIFTLWRNCTRVVALMQDLQLTLLAPVKRVISPAPAVLTYDPDLYWLLICNVEYRHVELLDLCYGRRLQVAAVGVPAAIQRRILPDRS
jgi:hypothetical protein